MAKCVYKFMMKLSVFQGVALLIVGGAGGFLLGNVLSGSSSEKQEVPEQSEVRSVVNELRQNRGNQMNKSLSEVIKRPGQLERLQGMLDLYDRLTPEQFEAEAERLSSLPGVERFVGAFLLYSKWGEEDPLAAMDYASRMGMMGMMVRPIVLQGWAAKDPNGAVSYYEANKNAFGMAGRFGGGMGPTATIASEWARQDPEAALAWAETLEGNDRSAAGQGIFSNLAVTDPKKAAELAGGLGNADERGAAVAEVARAWGANDWESTQEWIASLPADERDAARAEAIRGLAQADAAAAATEVNKLPAGENKDRAVADVAQSMAMTDPAKAANWLTENGSPEAQTQAVNDVVRNWASSDPDQARAWVTQQNDGPVKDRATASFVNSANVPEPERLEMAMNISDERLQERTLIRTGRQWYGSDPEAATQWMESTPGLAPETIESMQRTRGNWRGRRR